MNDNTDRFARNAAQGRFRGFDFETCPAKPCSRDDALAAMRADRFCLFNNKMTHGVEQFARGMYENFRLSEWFDFGRVDADALAAAGEDAKPFIAEGLLRAPYQRCVFRCRLAGGRDSREIELLLLVVEDLGYTGVFCMRSNGIRNEYLSVMSGIIIKGGDVRGVGPEQIKDQHLVTLFEYAGLWSILNTRGVGKAVDEPSEKLNRVRTKAGKEPLRRVTRVDSARYVTALRETVRMERAGEAVGDRRSPRMHLRRGHMRNLSADRFKGQRGKAIWIRSMIVGGDIERVADRQRYEVKR